MYIYGPLFNDQRLQTKSGRRCADKPPIFCEEIGYQSRGLFFRRFAKAASTLIFPGHALHEKGLQRQIGVEVLVCNQGRRSVVVPRINRLSTRRFVPPSVYIEFCLFVLAMRRSRQLSSMLWRARDPVVSWANRPVDVPSCPAPFRLAAPPCAALPRPARGIFLFLDTTGIHVSSSRDF